MMKTRSGETLRMIELLDEGREKALQRLEARGGDLPREAWQGLADQLSLAAIKYTDLSSDRIKDYVFDWDRMLAFEGNTGPYLQYAHARICSIARKAADLGITAGADTPLLLATEPERRLAVELLMLEPVLASVERTLEPHKLCGYLYELATTFTSFYESSPVLRADDAATRASRLLLCQATRSVLALGLGLLGMAAPERM
jgi:arginyl-tRNA synthetase